MKVVDMKNFFIVVLLLSLLSAESIQFVSPNDSQGRVFTTNSNDAYSGGRGIVFQMAQDFELNSVGIFQDLTGIDLSFEVAEVISLTGNVSASGENILASGSRNVTTDGLEFIDFSFNSLLLEAGSIYHIDFSFNGISNQNFFHNNANVAFDQGVFLSLEGTAGNNTGNSVVASFRLNGEANVNTVPEPSTYLAFLLGALLLGVRIRRFSA